MVWALIGRLASQGIVDLFYFPLWWYSGGILYWGKKCLGLLTLGNQALSPGLWFKNLFVPMYGQRDWQGRLISFGMRLVQGVVRGIVLAIWAALCMGIFLVWLALPIICLLGIYQAASSPLFSLK